MAEVLQIKNVGTESVSTQKPKKTRKNFVGMAILYIKAKWQARKIVKALGEAKQIQRGKRTGKSYDEFLKEL